MTRNTVPPTGIDEAVAESLRLVEMNGGRPPGDRSLCLPATDLNLQSLRRFGHAVLFRFVAGIAGLAAGAALAAFHPQAGVSVGLTVAMGCCSVGGILLLLSNPFFQRRFVRRQIGGRYEELASNGSYSVLLCVGIENAATFHRIKLVSDDVGYLALDPSRESLVIEGVRFRYRILGKDVRAVGPAGGSGVGTEMECAVGSIILRIALQYDSIWDELKRQTVGVRADSLTARISETLGIQGMPPPG